MGRDGAGPLVGLDWRKCACIASWLHAAAESSRVTHQAKSGFHVKQVKHVCAARAGSLYDSAMPQISTFLTFDNQAEGAARFYTSIFPNSKITRITRYPDLGPGSPFTAGAVMTVEFTLDGRAFTALNGGPQFTFTQGISIAVLCDTQQQVDEYWGKFVAAGGKPVACGWITDHFGVSWQIDPKLLIEMIADPDPVKAGKAMQAMMTMVKIDSEQLKRAVGT
jgi:predicted 3-demethylubiquinone-9 3-methyltransferase (glyoxalase superfamily)